jgi:hypothetical protein
MYDDDSNGFTNGRKPRASVSIQRRFDLGNYEHYQISVSASEDLEPGETMDEKITQLIAECSVGIYSGAAEEVEENNHPNKIAQRFVAFKKLDDFD